MTEYKFSGLDEWEQALSETIEHQYPEEFRELVIDIAVQLEGKVKEQTPVKTGRLQNEWHLGEIKSWEIRTISRSTTTWSTRSR